MPSFSEKGNRRSRSSCSSMGSGAVLPTIIIFSSVFSGCVGLFVIMNANMGPNLVDVYCVCGSADFRKEQSSNFGQ